MDRIYKTRHVSAEILEICKHEQVPVMIDCAFFGMCKGIDIQANSSVQMIAFSLSKCYHLDSHRIGMIYSNAPPSGIEVLNRFVYTSKFGATMALELFDRFGPDYIYSKYSHMQHRICETLDHMTPSDTVIFGNGDSNWSMFDRGGIHNRISFGSFISNVNDTSF